MNRLIDIAQAIDNLSRSSEGGLPVRDGDAGVGNVVMRNEPGGGF
ncbi:hypothetical protein [Pseudomonas sp. Irchel s3a18]|nr:hypothetical protein [Pseudomonas sp. Irchel s3a18]